MSETGLAETSQETTPAPTMYREEEQDETVAKGHIRVTEVIVYDVVGKKKNEDGKEVDVEKGRRPYFYQDPEDYITFRDKNPKARLETFGIQMLRSTAIKYLNDSENMKQFERKM